MKNLINTFASFPMIASLLIGGIALSSCEKQEITPISTQQTEYYEDSDKLPQDEDKSDRTPQIRASKSVDPIAISSPESASKVDPGTLSASNLDPVEAAIMPLRVFEYLDAHYPGIAIDKVDSFFVPQKGIAYFLVHLGNGITLKFSKDGQLIDNQGNPVSNTGTPGVDCEECYKSFQAVYPDKDYVQN